MNDPSQEHVEFLQQLVDNVKDMLGGNKMVAAIGEEQNGCYAVIICVNSLPPQLVMMTVAAMLTEQVLKDMGRRYNEFKTGSSTIN